jgi:hypothetical protein
MKAIHRPKQTLTGIPPFRVTMEHDAQRLDDRCAQEAWISSTRFSHTLKRRNESFWAKFFLEI